MSNQPKCGDALQLGSKGRYGSFHLWISVPHAIPERFKEEFLMIMIKCYTNRRLLPWAHPSQHPEWHHSWFSCFCRAQSWQTNQQTTLFCL